MTRALRAISALSRRETIETTKRVQRSAYRVSSKNREPIADARAPRLEKSSSTKAHGEISSHHSVGTNPLASLLCPGSGQR